METTKSAPPLMNTGTPRKELAFLIQPDELLSPPPRKATATATTTISICSSMSSSKDEADDSLNKKTKRRCYPIIKLALEETKDKGPFRRIDWDINNVAVSDYKHNHTKSSNSKEERVIKQRRRDDYGCNTTTPNNNRKNSKSRRKNNSNHNNVMDDDDDDDDEAFCELRMRAIELKTGKPSTRHETFRYHVRFTYQDQESEDCIVMSAHVSS
jgi:hypothetical protein